MIRQYSEQSSGAK